ncbi:MAG: ABC-F family ATP-binding cassette domain-containing protein [Ruminococcaceae bacterium]|nr:ABC-F family ATP-binding cassette domain-containing protein [Oscillospiraceae bacterium]
MAILQVQNLTVSFGERTLFSGGSFGVEERDKIGIIGGNGVGKTTLFRVITGELRPTDGSVAAAGDCKIGYLEQHAMAGSDETLYEAVESVFEPLRRMERELAEIAAEIDLGLGDLERLTARQHTLTENYQAGGGLTYKSRCRAALLGVGFSEEMLERPVSFLSGGERTMASLARLLLSDASLILLDEPTNHLDMEACAWLEEYLRAWRGAALIVSHDRYFLDRVTNKTVLVSGGRFTAYEGAYTEFMKKREAEYAFEKRRYQKQQQEIRRIEGIIETQRRWGRERNIRMAESKQKQIDRIAVDMERPPEDEKDVFISFHPARESAYEVLRGTGLSQQFDGEQLFRDADLQIYKNERVILVGRNGCGKTTLFSILRGARMPDSGTVTVGPRVDLGYYDQTQQDLPPQKTALEVVRDAFPQKTETQLRTALAALGLRGEAVHETVGTLSGGERAKVALVRLLLGAPNFLLLDEPTNHLDIDAKEALEAALLEYGGTVLAISHDRYFINKLATRILSMDPDGLKSYDGDYTYYLEKRTVPAEKTEAAVPKKENTYKEEKARQAEERKKKNRFAKVEAEIEKTEAAIAEKNDLLQEAGADYQRCMELSGEISALETTLEALYEEWEQLSEEIASK